MPKQKRVIIDHRPQMEHVPRFPLDRRCKWPGIFELIDSGERMPETVYVAAAGPNGKDILPLIPEDGYTIAVNSLINYPRAWDWWVAFDHRIVSMDWWPHFSVPPSTRTLIGARFANMLVMHPRETFGRSETFRPDYVFEYMNRLHNNFVANSFKRNPDGSITGRNPVLIPGLLRGGLTVTGIAIQLAYYCGAKNIVLIGCDFKGQGHWDGFINPSHYYKETWIWKEIMENFCLWLAQERGTTVYTASDSTLKLPRWTLNEKTSSVT